MYGSPGRQEIPDTGHSPLPPGKSVKLIAWYIVLFALYFVLATIFGIFHLLGGVLFLVDGDSTGLVLMLAGVLFVAGIFAIIGALAFARLAIITRGQLVTRETVHLSPGEYIDVRRAHKNRKFARNSLIAVTVLDVLGSVAGVVAPVFMGGHPADPVSWVAPFTGILAWLLCLPGFFVVSGQWKKTLPGHLHPNGPRHP